MQKKPGVHGNLYSSFLSMLQHQLATKASMSTHEYFSTKKIVHLGSDFSGLHFTTDYWVLFQRKSCNVKIIKKNIYTSSHYCFKTSNRHFQGKGAPGRFPVSQMVSSSLLSAVVFSSKMLPVHQLYSIYILIMYKNNIKLYHTFFPAHWNQRFPLSPLLHPPNNKPTCSLVDIRLWKQLKLV